MLVLLFEVVSGELACLPQDDLSNYSRASTTPTAASDPQDAAMGEGTRVSDAGTGSAGQGGSGAGGSAGVGGGGGASADAGDGGIELDASAGPGTIDAGRRELADAAAEPLADAAP